MANSPNQKRADDIRPDAQKRFEMAVDAALHTPPMHRTAKPKPRRPSRKAKKSA